MEQEPSGSMVQDSAIVAIGRRQIPQGRQAWAASDRHRFLFPLGGEVVVATARRNGEKQDVTIGHDECIPVPSGVETDWTFERSCDVVEVEILPDRLRAFTRNELKTLIVGNRIVDRLVLADRELARVAKRLDRCVSDTGIGHDIIRDALCRIFLVTLVQHYAIEDAGGGRFGGRLSVRRFRSLQDFIAERIAGPIRVREMARHVGMSEAAFARELKASVHETPARFVLRARVRKARELLTGTDDPVAVIAATCGFSDQAHLARSFRRQMGFSPLAFRHAARTGIGDLPAGIDVGEADRASVHDVYRIPAQNGENVQETDRRVQSGEALEA